MPPPASEPEDPGFDAAETGTYSSGFLSGFFERKIASLRGTQKSALLGIGSQSFKFVGDIALLVLAVLWLGTSLWAEFIADEEGEGGDAIEAKAKEEENEKKQQEDKEAADIFAKQIKPLIKNRCFDCHEGESAKAKLDLSVMEDNDMTGVAGLLSSVTPGNSGGSELLTRIKSTGDDRMPPEGKGEMFTAEEADQLAKWIDAGAPLPQPAVDTEKIISAVSTLFKGVLPIALILILHYFTGVLFNSGDALIRQTPSRLSSIGLLKAMAMVLLLMGFVAGAAGLVYGILDITRGFSDNWLKVLAKIASGILLYICFSSLARLWIKPGQLNIKPGEGNNAGEEVFGLLELFAKTMFKSAPILYGTALIFFLMFEGMNIVGNIPTAQAGTEEIVTTATDEGMIAALSNTLKETYADVVTYFRESPETVIGKYLDRGSVLTMAVKIPIYLFFYFLFAYLCVAVGRAVLKISRKLGAE